MLAGCAFRSTVYVAVSMSIAKIEVLNGMGLRSIWELRNRMLEPASLLLPLREAWGRATLVPQCWVKAELLP